MRLRYNLDANANKDHRPAIAGMCFRDKTGLPLAAFFKHAFFLARY
jgi:hypothetical protein